MRTVYQSWDDDDENAPIIEATVEKIKKRLFLRAQVETKEYEWIATIDSRIRDRHRKMNAP